MKVAIMNENQVRLPPIIRDYIDNMHNPRNSKNQRDIAYLMLKNIILECQRAIDVYNKADKRSR